jgi:hypothetical protein
MRVEVAWPDDAATAAVAAALRRCADLLDPPPPPPAPVVAGPARTRVPKGVHLERSSSGTLPYCVACGWRRGPMNNPDEAYDVARRHRCGGRT